MKTPNFTHSLRRRSFSNSLYLWLNSYNLILTNYKTQKPQITLQQATLLQINVSLFLYNLYNHSQMLQIRHHINKIHQTNIKIYHNKFTRERFKNMVH